MAVYRMDAMMQRYVRVGRGATPQAWSHDDRLRNQTTSTSSSSSSGTKNDDERKRKKACCVVARGTRRALVSGSAMAGLSFTLVSFPEMANAANASGSVGSNSEEATIAKLLKYGRLEGDPFTALDFLDDAVKRAERMVAASEDGGDGDGGRAFGVLASCLVARGNALLGAQDWDAADADLTRAASMLSSLPEPSTSEQQGQVFSYYEASANCTVCNSRQMALSLAYDGIGHSLSQRGRFEEAVMAFEACSGVLASNASIGLDVEEVPRGWFVAGLRGGPPTMLQRARLNVALAKYGAGDTVGSLSILQVGGG